MLKESLEDLFLCTGWNSVFPNLFKAIEDVGPTQWNYFFSQLNKSIFNDKDKIKQLLYLTKELDNRDSLEALTQSLKSLIDINPYQFLGPFFQCMEDSKSTSCLSRDLPQKNILKELFRDFSITKETLDIIINTMDAFLVAFSPNQSLLRESYPDVHTNEKFLSQRIKLVSTILEALSSARETNQSPLSSLIYIDQNHYLGEVLHTGDQRKAMTEFAVGPTDDFFNDLVIYKDLLRADRLCDHSDTDLYFSTRDYFDSFLLKIMSSNLQEFHNLLINETILDRYIIDICPSIVERPGTSNYLFNPSNIKKSLAFLVKNENDLHLLKYIMTSLKAKDNNNINIIEFASNPLVVNTIMFLKTTVEQDRSMLLIFVDILSGLDRQSYENISKLINIISNKDYSLQFRRLKEFWDFFTDEEKNRFFSYFDSHFSNNIDIVLIMNFANEIVKILKEDIIFFFKEILNEESVDHLQNIIKNFNDPHVLSDLRSFYSRDHIMRIIKILGDSLRDTATKQTILMPTVSEQNKQNSTLPLSHNDSITKCINTISTLSGEFLAPLSQNFNSFCPGIEKENIKILLDILWMTEPLSSIPSLGRLFVKNAKIIESYLHQEEEIKNHFQRNIPGLLQQEDTKKVLKNILDLLVSLSEGQDGKYRKKLYKMFSMNKNLRVRTKNIIKSIPPILQSWQHFAMDKQYYQFGEITPKTECKNVQNMNIGGNPCPMPTEISENLNETIRMAIKRPSMGTPGLIHQHLRAFSVDHGLSLPKQGLENNMYNITIEDAIKFLHETHDKSQTIAIPYTNEHFQQNTEETTLLERIEILIRENRLDNNLFTIHFVNNMMKSDSEYNKIVATSKRILRLCLSLRFCGTIINSEKRKFANNILATFSSLESINRPPLEYGPFIKVFLKIYGSSSPPSFQGKSIFNHFSRSSSTSDLKEHNINLLTHMAHFALFSNMARFLEDRSINKKDIQFLSEEFLKNINLHHVEDLIRSIVENALNVQDASGRNLVEFMAHRINSMNYSELRTVENTLANALIVIHYLGPLKSQSGHAFAENSMETFFSILGTLLKDWPSLIEVSPHRKRFIHYIKYINNVLVFLKMNLHNKETREHYYIFINELFYVLKKMTLIENRQTNMLKSFLEKLPYHTEKIDETIGLLEKMSTQFDKNKIYKYIALFVKILADDQLQVGPFLAYLRHVARESYHHFDRPYLILKFIIENFDQLYAQFTNQQQQVFNLLDHSLQPFYTK